MSELVEDFYKRQSDILSGISAELDETDKPVDYQVLSSTKEGEIWRIQVDLMREGAKGLDESLEGSAAWWPGPPKGFADVLSVLPEDEQINLRFAKSQPPASGLIKIYPPRYLEALQNCWEKKHLAEKCLKWLENIDRENNFDASRVPTTNDFPWLRESQASAFQLLGWKTSFLWGPPGTGKTTTIGAMLAQYLIQFPRSKILLLSTTNSAVDQALVSVDIALAKISKRLPSVADTRKRCLRVGNHFIAAHYKGREHLVPVKDHSLIGQLTKLETERPDKSDVQKYARWKAEAESVRNAIRQQSIGILDTARLAAMTTTRAVFTFEELNKQYYDLIVFDEASQVGLAHALMIAPLSRSVMFAGDPKQLAPIVQSNNSSAKRWLGRSIFAHMKEGASSTCMLTEQSRMTEQICKIVSDIFYNGELVVARDCKNNAEWSKKRQLASIPSIGSKSVHLEMVRENGTWSQKYGGNIRYATAELISNLVCNIARTVDETDILVLTPFRAQRTLIKVLLKNAGCKRVSVNTVHRTQGSECHTVIFDPVVGDNNFLKTEDAPRLINVAISRAQARLVIVLSASDRNNPLFDQIANVIENTEHSKTAITISELVSDPEFPRNALNKVVQIKNKIGRCVEISEESNRLCIINFKTGKKEKYNIEKLKQIFQKRSTSQASSNKRDESKSVSPIPTARLVGKGNFPESSLGQQAVPNSRRWIVRELSTGRIISFNTQEVINRAREKSIEQKASKDSQAKPAERTKKI